LNKANQLHPKWVLGINALGMAYRRFNKYSEAIDQFQKAVSLDKKFVPSYFNLGEAQSSSGKKKDAARTLEKLTQLDPELAKKLKEGMNKQNLEKEE
jgi:tetratricopeptide (TPR) repeat protein